MQKHDTIDGSIFERKGKTFCKFFIVNVTSNVFVFLNSEFELVKTTRYAMEMAAKRVVEGRTWESLRLHFCVIRKNLDSYDFLTESRGRLGRRGQAGRQAIKHLQVHNRCAGLLVDRELVPLQGDGSS